jgi:hypothetical protein
MNWKSVVPMAAARAAYRALLPLANPAGKVELQFLLAHQKQLSAAVQEASSAAKYLEAQKKLTSARVTRDIAILAQAPKHCSTA